MVQGKRAEEAEDLGHRPISAPEQQSGLGNVLQ